MYLSRIFCLLAACAAQGSAQQFVISTLAGGGLATGGPALNAAIGSPAAIATDASGNVYFAAPYSVYRLNQDGTLTRVAGRGTWGFSGDGGLATDAQLDSPTALAVDNSGNLYIAEAGGHIREVTPDGIIKTIAGNGICHGGCFTNGAGDGGPALSAQLFYPWQLASDSAGNLYVGEWNTTRIRKISVDGIITTAVGNGSDGYSGDGGPATSAAIGAPWGLAFDSAGNLYFSDDIPGDDYAPDAVRVRKVSPDGIITTVAGTGAPGASPDTGDGGPAISAQFAVAGSLVVDSAGNLFIADFSRIRKVSTDGIITTIAGGGEPGYSGDGGPAASAKLSGSFYGPGLAADRSGNLYLADSYNNRIRKISADGFIVTVAGNGAGCCYSGDGGPAIQAELYVPTGVAVDGAGRVFVADTYNDRVRMISATGVITTLAGAGGRANPRDGGPAASAGLYWPSSVKLDNAGNLYIADTGDMRVRRISPDGVITTVAGNGNTDGGYSGDSGAATNAQLSWPKDIAFDASGNLYIADTANHAVRKVSPDGVITTFAGTGASGYSGDGGPAANARMNYPSGLAVDGAGNLYVSDTNNFRVRKITPGGMITTVAGNGSKGYSGNGGPAIEAQLTSPTGLAFDAAGNLYIGDGGSVRMLSRDGIISTVAGNGVIGYAGDGGPATSAQMSAWGLTFDSAGNLYVADPSNNAVRLLRPVRSEAQ